MNPSTAELLSWFVKTSYLVAATLFLPELHNVPLILAALAIGTGVAWWSAKKVAITDMPQMVALYNGMGGGSAAAIGAVELLRFSFSPIATRRTGARRPLPNWRRGGRTPPRWRWR